MSINEPLVSVIIPSYNHEKYISDCIDSIVNQTYKNIQLIIIDDGSTDNSPSIINKKVVSIKDCFGDIVFISNESNQGVLKSLNQALLEVRGEYISFCASDDKLLPSNIEMLSGFLSQNNDYVFAVGDNQIIDGSGKICYWNEKRDNLYDLSSAKYKTFGEFLRSARKDIDFFSEEFGMYETFLRSNYIPNGFLVRKKILCDEMGGYPRNCPLEDLGLHLHLSRYGKYKFFHEPLAQYRWHGSNTMIVNYDTVYNNTILTLNTQLAYAYGKFGFDYLFELFVDSYQVTASELVKLYPNDAINRLVQTSIDLKIKSEEFNRQNLELTEYKNEIFRIYDSLYWKLTKPFRICLRLVKLGLYKMISR
ncbi:glycosyltransferase family 2 protein [Francisella philomiragia]|uniref:Glycosyltransferase involved in cell wall biogenesis-like protein n=1 Tax=Francisella philomiragia subsp. philomiragia (strain ATCC 25017 / CCUG 19701 / FSC 153 / O\|nr:glycosyltransferase family 2 protein [Francisella philomiragia]AJI47918.1 glycosyl transferase 2 family protein [Francisella philomiragia]AJI49399.1 glycosyltransferase like 2 family protein [Francisella philomiragia]MBK2020725.1 glycosyltransferase family 2 protein [Francisella philomiragia]MBK2030855.1 glycosyltransferase family 2 protein [Francisella philomiragia]MBK2263487.1 glycosyltransferase family 2 protein [Francisella philomiragia]